MELTDKEKQFLLNMLKQVSVNALQPDAAEAVTVVRSIAEKLK